jgi:hypothetical protein
MEIHGSPADPDHITGVVLTGARDPDVNQLAMGM